MKKILWLFLVFALSAEGATNLWIETGKAHGIEPRLLYAISKVESNNTPLVLSVNHKKATKAQLEKLYKVLEYKNIRHYTHEKVVEIHNRDAFMAKEMIKFLDTNNYVSFDIGLMQINNIHKEALAKKGIKLEDLINEHTNLNVAAGILWECYKKHRSVDKALNAYNGKLVGNNYYAKVAGELSKLLLPHEYNRSKNLFYRIL